MRRIVRRLSCRGVVVSALAVSLLGVAACAAPVKAPPPGPRCALPSLNGWNHYETQYTRGFRPAANWPLVDGANASTVSSPVGNAASGYAFTSDPFVVFPTPNDVLNKVFINPVFGPRSITNIQVVSSSAVYPLAGGQARNWEIVGINQGELLNRGTPIRAFITGHVVRGVYAAWWLEIAYQDVFEGVCGTLNQIRATMSRIPQAPATL